MKNLPNNLYHKIQQLSEEVRKDLKRKGVVAPVKNEDGTISIGYYTIVKYADGYKVLDSFGDVVVDQVNLPQSAVLIANSLALGKYKDYGIIDSDRRYGYALFDEELHMRAATNKKKPLEHFDLMTTKAAIAKSKKEFHKRDLLNKYEKLIQQV